MNNFIQKSIDLTLPGAEYEIKKHLAYGWYIYKYSLLYCYIRKNIEEVKH